MDTPVDGGEANQPHRCVGVLPDGDPEGSGGRLNNHRVLTTGLLLGAQPDGLSPPTNPVQADAPGPQVFDVDQVRKAGAAAVLDLKGVGPTPSMPLPGYVALTSKMLKDKFYVQIFAMVTDGEGQRDVREVRGFLTDDPITRSKRQSRGLGEVGFVADTAIPKPPFSLKGALVMAADDDCIVGIVTQVDVGSQIDILVLPVRRAEAQPADDTVQLLQQHSLPLRKCDIETDVMAPL